MPTTEVVTVMSRIPDPVRESYYKPGVFLKSLERFDVKPTILGLGEPWGGLMTKPRRLREWLRSGGCKSDILINCDSYDIVFTVPPDEVGEAYLKGWPHLPIVMNAERGLFPRGELENAFRRVPGPWKFLNSGFMIGPPATILALLESMWLDDIADDFRAGDALHGGAGRDINPNDQGHYQYAYAAQVVPIALDSQCKLCQCYSACSIDEFDFTGARIKNAVTGEYPLVGHFNGNSKDILLPAFLRKWGLEG